MADIKRKHGKNSVKFRRGAKHRHNGYYVRRFGITEKNRYKKRLKHLKKYPNDLQTRELLAVKV